MSNIIRTNFTGRDTCPYNDGLGAKELMRYAENNLKVRLTEPNDGQFAVSIYEEDEIHRATGKCAKSLSNATAAFNEIADHIEAADRSFDELAMILSQRLNK